MEMKDRLKEARKKAGLTQRKLAKLCDIDQSTIASLETANRKASPRTIRDLAQALGVRREWLESGDGPMYPGEDLPKTPEQEVLAILEESYKMTPEERALVVEFLRLEPEERKTVVEFLSRSANPKN